MFARNDQAAFKQPDPFLIYSTETANVLHASQFVNCHIAFCFSTVPIRSIKMTAQDSDGSHPISFVNNGQATFEEDEERRIYCYVNGSYPVASVNMMLGEEDITHMFDKSVKLITEGEIMSTAGLSYEITLSNPAFQIKFDYMNKMLQCNAHMPGTDFPSESNGVMIKLAGCE